MEDSVEEKEYLASQLTIEPVVSLMQKIESYSSTIPDAVIASYLQQAGLDSDPRICRIIGLAAQKFISEVANDAMTKCRIRTQQFNRVKPKERKYTLCMEDLDPVLKEYGIIVRKPPYFV